jgi:glycosyltransferase involved in cell wall biosynthesis
LVIVTNDEHVKYVNSIGGKAVICEDPLPDITRYVGKDGSEKSVFYICSFDVDEPYEIAFEAAEQLAADNFKFYVSGNFKRVNINPVNYPSVSLLGYVSEQEYYTYLYQSSVILDLTECENILLCGAYEAMAAEKPLVTSETMCLRKYFHKGTVFTKHDKKSIADAIRTAYKKRHQLINDIKLWKANIEKHQNNRKLNIYRELGINGG